MPDKKISQLNAAAALDGTEMVPVVQSGDNARTTVDGFATRFAALSGASPTGTFNFTLAATTTDAVTAKVTGDAAARFIANADGKIEWGDGTNAVDTNLYRSAADTLKTDDYMVAPRFSTQGATPGSQYSSAGTHPGTTVNLAAFNAATTIPKTCTTSFTAYQSAVSTVAESFTLDDYYGFKVNGPTVGVGSTVTTLTGLFIDALSQGGTTNIGLKIGAATTNTVWISSNADNTTAAAGIVFGASKDTNLYRSAADTLKTDDAMVVGGAYVSVGTTSAASGAIRLPDSSYIKWRNSGNTGDTAQIINTSSVFYYDALEAGGQHVFRTTAGYSSALTTDATGTTVHGSFLKVGTNPATTGAIRLPNNNAITWRNAANNADIAQIYCGTGTAADLYYDAGTVHHFRSYGPMPCVDIGNAYVAVGINPATTGSVRIPNATYIYSRNAANTADCAIIGLTSGNYVYFGTQIQSLPLWGGTDITGSAGGTTIATAASQPLAFYGATPIVQPTSAGTTAGTFAANSGTAVNDASTFDGWTIGKAIKALINVGLLKQE